MNVCCEPIRGAKRRECSNSACRLAVSRERQVLADFALSRFVAPYRGDVRQHEDGAVATSIGANHGA